MQIDDKGVSVLLAPPIGDGEGIRVNELKDYLDMIGVPYDNSKLNSALVEMEDEEVTFFLSPMKIPPVDEKCTVDVMSDKMTAILRMFPPSTGGLPTSKAKILDMMNASRITTGIDTKAIEDALADRQYCTDIVVARGKKVTAGRDASIVYHFDTDNSMRPELKEDGTVDFFKLNMLHHCTKGQVLAEIIPEQKGDDGVDVYGNITPAREVKRATFAHGRNLEISEDGLQLISMVDGHASLVEGSVFVADVYSVENVDTSTGNIEYHGNVEVKGNVCENFSVKTDGNVFVKGVVEGAVIEAGGNIVIARGMYGQNKGRLKAGGNIIAKFLSAADVEADGFVEAEQILNSKVVATAVHAEAGKGLINGGKIVAKSAVSVKNAGSPMGTSTILEVGTDSDAKKRLMELQKSVGEKSKAATQMKKVMEETARKIKGGAKLSMEQLKNAKMLGGTLQQTQEQVAAELKEIEKLDKMLKGSDNAHIDVRGTVYQGVNLSISGATLNVKNEYTFCRLIKKGADIASTNL
jgi:uncharacterized protein (DUF342 family)